MHDITLITQIDYETRSFQSNQSKIVNVIVFSHLKTFQQINFDLPSKWSKFESSDVLIVKATSVMMISCLDLGLK